MPRLFHKVVNPTSKKDLQRLIEDLHVKVYIRKDVADISATQYELLDNLLSFRTKLDDMSQVQVDLLWETAARLVKDLLGCRPDEVITEAQVGGRSHFLDGLYWIIPKSGRFIRCGDENHFAKASSFLPVLGRELRLDGWDLERALSCGEGKLVPLLLEAGAIRSSFSIENKQKVGRHQLCNSSVPWLKNKLAKMPVLYHHIWVFDPRKEYNGPETGIYFKFRRASLSRRRRTEK